MRLAGRIRALERRYEAQLNAEIDRQLARFTPEEQAELLRDFIAEIRYGGLFKWRPSSGRGLPVHARAVLSASAVLISHILSFDKFGGGAMEPCKRRRQPAVRAASADQGLRGHEAMTQNRRLVAVRMFLSVYAGIVAVPTWGQVAKKAPVPKTAMEIEEITVVAQKREEDIQEVPISIVAITGELLEAKGLTGGTAREVVGL